MSRSTTFNLKRYDWLIRNIKSDLIGQGYIVVRIYLDYRTLFLQTIAYFSSPDVNHASTC
jgi:hypothetical protein